MRPIGMELSRTATRRDPWRRSAAALWCAAAMALLLISSLPAPAQDNVIGTAMLPRDLSVQGMFLNANAVVQAVMIGLVFASVVTWTVWLAKSIEIFLAKRRLRAASNKLASVRSTREGVEQLAGAQGEV